jgi:hypothetical protein
MQKKNKLTRRDFLAGSGALILTGLLAGCTPKTVTTTVNSTKTSTLISTIMEGSNTTETVTETSTVTIQPHKPQRFTKLQLYIPARTVVMTSTGSHSPPDVMDKVLVLTKGVMMDETMKME